MRALFVEHDHLSPPGPLAERLEQRGYSITRMVVVPAEHYTQPNIPHVFPSWEEFDVVIVMGANWGAWDDDAIGQWLLPELEWLRELHQHEVPTLGVCFGGQALARALGGSVAPGPRPEIGYTWIHSDDRDLIPPGPWFQFHYDRWQVPPKAREIARSPLASQAFVLGRSLAVQFHPEVTPDTLSEWMLDVEITGSGTPAAIAADSQDLQKLQRLVAQEEADSVKRAHALIDAFIDRVAKL